MELLRRPFRNPFYKLLGLTIALSAWLYVQGRQVVEDRVRGEVMWRLPPDLATIEPLPNVVSATVSGSRSAVRRAARSPLRLEVDLRQSKLGDHALEFSVLEFGGLPAGVEVLQVTPSSVQFVLDEVTTRKMKVVPIPIGDPAPGYTVEGVSVEPSVVEVSGPRSVVANQLEISTKPIDVSKIDGHRTVPVELDVAWGVTYAGSDLMAQIEVSALEHHVNIIGVPISVLDATSTWAVSVGSVEVELVGPAAPLARLDQRRLAVLVYLPDEPTEARYQVALGTSGARMEPINLPAEVRAEGVVPSVVEVYRKK